MPISESDRTVTEGEQSVVGPNSHHVTGLPWSAALAKDDGAGPGVFAAGQFDAKILGARIAAVPG